MPEPFTLYYMNDDQDVARIREHLQYRGIPFEEINLEENPDEQKFLALNNTVDMMTPTLLMGPDEDKIFLDNPSIERLDAALDEFGYTNPRPDDTEDDIPNVKPPPAHHA